MDKTYTSEAVLELMRDRKEELHVTNAWIADESGVPESTVTKLFNGTIKSPTLDTVLPVAKVLDVSLFDPEALPAPPKSKSVPGDQFLTLLIDSYTSQLRSKDRWLLGSLGVNIALVAVLAFLVLWDVTHPDMGWIQYAKSHGWMEIGDWLRGFFAV